MAGKGGKGIGKVGAKRHAKKAAKITLKASQNLQLEDLQVEEVLKESQLSFMMIQEQYLNRFWNLLLKILLFIQNTQEEKP